MKKFEIMTNCVLGAMVACTSVSHAFDSYLPPERISCFVEAGSVVCEGFDSGILEVLQYPSQLDSKKPRTFYFMEGMANFMTEDYVEISFTYTDMSGEVVKLSAMNELARPDLANPRSSWLKQNNVYICNAGYMSCPVTTVRSR